jgi:uncharacterized protein YndB with AHSA1/START domain
MSLPPIAPAAADEFLISRTLHAPRAKVWRAWTEPEHFARWWGPHIMQNPECTLDVRVVMQGPDGVPYPIRGKYLEVSPMGRLVMTLDCTDHPGSWHDMVRAESGVQRPYASGIMVQTVTFEEDGDATRLTIRTRFDSTAIRNAMVKMGMKDGWSESLEKLDAVVTGLAERQIVVSRIVNAPAERVFAAFADPAQVVQWWGPNGFVTRTISSDLRVGGAWRYTMTGPDGKVFPNKNVFVEIVPGARIVYDSVQDNGDGKPDGPAHFRSTISFAGHGGVTRVTLSLLFPTNEARNFVVREHNAIEGGKQTLARLESHLANG